jgi:hypothetical protein
MADVAGRDPPSGFEAYQLIGRASSTQLAKPRSPRKPACVSPWRPRRANGDSEREKGRSSQSIASVISRRASSRRYFLDFFMRPGREKKSFALSGASRTGYGCSDFGALGSISRMSRLQAAIVSLLIVAASAHASGDTDALAPAGMANRVEPSQVVIKRILESDRPNAAKLAALARFVKIGDGLNGLEKRFGYPGKTFFHNWRAQAIYFRESGLVVRYSDGKVTSLIYRKDNRDCTLE